MKYHPINPALFIKNRKNFMAKMKPSSLAVFNSNDVFTTGADSTLPFKQHRDLFYLSGADQENTILVLFQIVQIQHIKKCFLLRKLTRTLLYGKVKN